MTHGHTAKCNFFLNFDELQIIAFNSDTQKVAYSNIQKYRVIFLASFGVF